MTVLSCYLVLELTFVEAVAYQLFTAKFLFLSYSCGGGARGAALGQVCLFLLILLQVEGGVFLTPALVHALSLVLVVPLVHTHPHPTREPGTA